ncbi:MAG: hypothetical protein LUC30_08205 [Clostridiales bacterium]|nr:hypothetical protein [Clostridiales bacterium]
MAQIISERPWLWATHVWNMYDFAADSRDEGGVKGRNNKGLVTMDRKTKKDSFYLYKAWWSSEPFVHICGRRYAERAGETLTLKIYSNLPEITLCMDGNPLGTKSGARIFLFENIPFPDGSHTFTASCQSVEDSIVLTRVAEENSAYHFAGADDDGVVANWFENKGTEEIPAMTFDAEYFSIRDTLGDILHHTKARAVFLPAISSLLGMKVGEETLAAMHTKTVEDMSDVCRVMVGDDADDKMALLNAELQKVRKEG